MATDSDVFDRLATVWCGIARPPHDDVVACQRTLNEARPTLNTNAFFGASRGDLGFGDQEELSAGEDLVYLPGRIYETRFNASLVDRHPETDVLRPLMEMSGPEAPAKRSDLRRVCARTPAVRTQRLPLPLCWLRR